MGSSLDLSFGGWSFGCGWLGFLGCLWHFDDPGGEDGVHVAPINAGALFHDGLVADSLDDFFDDSVADVAMDHFASAEHDHHFDFVFFLQEPQDVLHLEIEIMVIGLGTELDFLDHDVLLLGPGRVFPLRFHELVLAVVHDPAHRRVGVSGHFHQIKTALFSDPDGLVWGHQAELFAIFGDDADLGGPDAVVDAGLVRTNGSSPSCTRTKSLPLERISAKQGKWSQRWRSRTSVARVVRNPSRGCTPRSPRCRCRTDTVPPSASRSPITSM